MGKIQLCSTQKKTPQHFMQTPKTCKAYSKTEVNIQIVNTQGVVSPWTKPSRKQLSAC